MNILAFKLLVTDYMNRAGVSFDVDSTTTTDKVTTAINHARQYAQRLVQFEYAKTYVQLTVSKTTGGSLSSAVALSDGITPVVVRTVKEAFVLASNGGYYPVDVVQRGPELQQLKRDAQDGCIDLRFPSNLVKTSRAPAVVLDGRTVWLEPWPGDQAGLTTITVKLRVLSWLSAYQNSFLTGQVTQNGNDGINAILKVDQGDLTLKGVKVGDNFVADQDVGDSVQGFHTDITANDQIKTTLGIQVPAITPYSIRFYHGPVTDFLMQFCEDWLMFRSIKELNFYLKEDQRVILNDAVVKEAWESVKSWNQEIAQTEDDLDL